MSEVIVKKMGGHRDQHQLWHDENPLRLQCDLFFISLLPVTFIGYMAHHRLTKLWWIFMKLISTHRTVRTDCPAPLRAGDSRSSLRWTRQRIPRLPRSATLRRPTSSRPTFHLHTPSPHFLIPRVKTPDTRIYRTPIRPSIPSISTSRQRGTPSARAQRTRGFCRSHTALWA